MGERIRNLRKLNRLSTIAASAVLFSACTADSGTAVKNPSPSAAEQTPSALISPTPEGTEKVTPTPFITPKPEKTPRPTPKPEKTPKPTPKPTPLPTEAPTPTENIQNSMEQEASNEALRNWLTTFLATQESDGNTYNVFAPGNIDIPSIQKTYETLAQGLESDTPITFSWSGGEAFYTDSDNKKALGIKTAGEIEITNIKLTTYKDNLTNKQKSEGVTWAGQTILQFDFTYAENQYHPSSDAKGEDVELVKEWLKEPDAGTLLPKSDVKTVVYDPQTFIFANGTWSLVNPEIYNADGWGPLKGLRLPVGAIANPKWCSPNAESSCQILAQDPPYN